MNTIMPKACCQRYTKKPTNGFTLVELMVSILIGLILLAVMSLAFLSNKQSYRAQDSSAQMQENGRYAIEVLTRDIRLAGYWGGFEHKVDSGKIIFPTGTIDPTTFGCDATNWAKMASQRIYGLNDTNNDASITGNYSAATCIPALPNGDVIVVRHASPISLAVTDLQVNVLYLKSDIDEMALFEGITPPTEAKLGTPFREPTTLQRVIANAYFLGNSLVECSAGAGTTPGAPLKGLRRLSSTSATTVGPSEEIIGGVEDFQVMYGVDNTNDGTADLYVNASALVDWPNVVSVRIWLLLRAACGESGYANTSTYTNPSGVATTIASDSIRRQVFTTTIFLRNPRYPSL